MEPEGPLQCSQRTTIGTYPEPDESRKEVPKELSKFEVQYTIL